MPSIYASIRKSKYRSMVFIIPLGEKKFKFVILKPVSGHLADLDTFSLLKATFTRVHSLELVTHITR